MSVIQTCGYFAFFFILMRKYEYGDYFEGDMELDDDQLAAIPGMRNILKKHKYRWPHAIVPFVLSKDYTAEEKENILQALEEIEQVSCVKFLSRSNETDYVHCTSRKIPDVIHKWVVEVANSSLIWKKLNVLLVEVGQ